MVPTDTSGSAVSPFTQPSAQPFDAGGSRYSPPERIQRALRLAQLHEENRKWHERETALVAWAHDTQPGPVALQRSKLRDLYNLLPDNSTRALAMLRNTSPDRTASPDRSRSPRPAQSMAKLDSDTPVFRRQRHRQRRPQEAPARTAHYERH